MQVYIFIWKRWSQHLYFKGIFCNYRGVPRIRPPLTYKPTSHFQPKFLHRYFCLANKPPPPVLLWVWNLAMWMLKPLKTIATCHVKAYFVVFLHQTASESAEIACPRGDRRSVMVVKRKYHDSMHKPPPLFCLMLACSVFAGSYGNRKFLESGSSCLSCNWL